MIIRSLECQFGILPNRKFCFYDHFTLIHSDLNSYGKTTLLRLVLYSLGYQIPSTKGMNFKETSTRLEIEKNNETYVIKRPVSPMGDIIILETKDGFERQYILPNQQEELHAQLFDIQNRDILNNILGVFYIDQEKGWTLLNRGVVIGSNKFSIEAFVRGLDARDCRSELDELRSIDDELLKYEKIQKIADYQGELSQAQGDLLAPSYDERANNHLFTLKAEKAVAVEELKTVKSLHKDNASAKELIESLKLVISYNNEYIPITTDKIVGLDDSIRFSTARFKLLEQKIWELDKEIAKIESPISEEKDLIHDTSNLLKYYTNKLSSIRISSVEIAEAISYLKKEKKRINAEIRRITKEGNKFVYDIYQDILYYSRLLEIRIPLPSSDNNLFTNDLKSYSGAEFHKLVFSYKLAYIKVIRKRFGIFLPIIIDSPSGKEVDSANVGKMMLLLEQEFYDHQIVIASIFNYDLKEYKKIILHESLLINENSEEFVSN